MGVSIWGSEGSPPPPPRPQRPSGEGRDGGIWRRKLKCWMEGGGKAYGRRLLAICLLEGGGGRADGRRLLGGGAKKELLLVKVALE